MAQNSICNILWDVPLSGLNSGSTILSFLTPLVEHELLETGTVKEVVTMSRVMDDVSPEARKLYLDLVADIGLYVLPDGRTLREALSNQSGSSLWWYHPVAFRDSECDLTYTNIMSILAIVREASTRGAETLHLVKPPRGLAECLGGIFAVEVENGVKPADWVDLVRGLLGRFKWMLRTILTQLVLKRHYRAPQKKLNVVLQGFWDWSISASDRSEGQLSDRYFGNLSNELIKRGKSVGYWCSYDPSTRPDQKKRKHSQILAPLKTRDDVLLFESQLNLSDIIFRGLDFRPLRTFLRIYKNPSFSKVFVRDGLDYYPLLKSHIIRGFIDNALPKFSLLEKVLTKICSVNNPELLICFLEHFPYSRAMYTGLKGTSVVSWAIQHASYNQGKTFGALHQSKEFTVHEDGHSVPHPDKICVMGENGEHFFRGCGYSSEQVLLTGSTRYDNTITTQNNTGNLYAKSKYGSQRKVLVVTSLPASIEFHLVRAAVEACKGLNSVALRLRAHPFGKMDKIPGYSKIKHLLEASNVSLDEDLQWADLILMSQSTVGEEAFLRGKSVWQFRFPHPDQSALAEVVPIPKFYTVAELRQAFINLIESSEISSPTQAEIEHVYRSLFQTEKERPSVAIAEAICKEFN